MAIRYNLILLLLSLPFLAAPVLGQAGVSTFSSSFGDKTYKLLGRDPAQGGTTTIPTVLVPITLKMESRSQGAGWDARRDVDSIVQSPLFTAFHFSDGGMTQYGDAMLRATFPQATSWHTLLERPTVVPVTITIPAANGYILTSRKNGGSLALVDADYLQNQLFLMLPRQAGKLVIAFAHNTIFYADSDATICCTTGTHGVDRTSGASFILGSYLKGAPAIVTERDVQPLSEQLAEFFNDPSHDPQVYGYGVAGPGNAVAPWLRAGPAHECGGAGIGSDYFLLEPTDTNPKNNFPASPAFTATTGDLTYHLQNVALLPWYAGVASSRPLSFPDVNALTTPATPCKRSDRTDRSAAALPVSAGIHEHKLIGYTGSTPLHAISPQWDYILVSFASPVKGAPEGTLRFTLPRTLDKAQFIADIAAIKKTGRKVMISLGGGGEYFKLTDAANIPNFVSSVSGIVAEYGFDGVDIDFESPSMILEPGDTDFRHPRTASTVNLISGLRQLHDRFGPSFMISLVPEGPQVPAGYLSYGGQFGSYLPLIYGLGDDLSFVDVQDYNTPPLEGLDGEIYQSHTVDYHAALTELLLHGFDVAGAPSQHFPAVAANKVAVGFLTDYEDPQVVSEAMRYLITGKAPAGSRYMLRSPAGYPGMLGAMFWNLDDDARRGYEFSNVIGPELHGFAR